MPEILEVEYYRRSAQACVGRTIVAVAAPDAWFCKRGTTPDELGARLPGEVIVGARRRGKLLMVDLGGGAVLGLRFGMTGRLIVDESPVIDRLEYAPRRDDPAWDRFSMTFAGAGSLRLQDPRRLGAVELDPDEDALGPDAWTADGEVMATVLGRSHAPLKARLLDQSRLAGLGNLLTDEILWRAELAPGRPAGSLDADEIEVLVNTTRRVLDELDRRGGSHTGDLHDERLAGGHCPIDGTPLRRDRLGGRTTYWCPTHQR